jgi:hypothetical protein
MVISKNAVKRPVGKDGKYKTDQEGMLLQTHKCKGNCNTRDDPANYESRNRPEQPCVW